MSTYTTYYKSPEWLEYKSALEREDRLYRKWYSALLAEFGDEADHARYDLELSTSTPDLKQRFEKYQDTIQETLQALLKCRALPVYDKLFPVAGTTLDTTLTDGVEC